MNVNGNDVKSLGYDEGPIIGKMLDHLKKKVEDNQLENEHECLMEYLKKINLEDLDYKYNG